MQRTAIILAYFFICANTFSQQYPFVHYTPKDGLISNQVRGIYQDSKGRLYFTSINGLSVYDGARFVNYTSKNGLALDIVNFVMEMGDDSIWIITNSPVINCLVKGKMKPLHLESEPPIIDQLLRDKNKVLYAASENGLFKFHRNSFIRLPFVSLNGQDKSRFISKIYSFGGHLLVERDYSMLPEEPTRVLYLYDKKTETVVAQKENILALDVAPDGRIWVSTGNRIMALDTIAINQGKIILQDLPPAFEKIKKLGGHFVTFDRGNNCWLGDQSRTLLKAEANGNLTSFSGTSGLNMFFINSIFLDRENITWIATNNAGLNKLVQGNFSLIENPFGFRSFDCDLSYNTEKKELLFYSVKDARLAIIKDESNINFLNVRNANEVDKIIGTPYGIFGIKRNNVFKLDIIGNTLSPRIVLNDTGQNIYGGGMVDKYGNFIVCGKHHVSAIVNGSTICQKKIGFFSDHAASDSRGNIWVVTRSGELTMLALHPDDPVNYLEEKKVFKKELADFSPRSIVIDKNDNIWIGSRNHGIHVYATKDKQLSRLFTITTANGLSADFTSHLSCDAENNIWASSALGLDKINVKNGIPVIENVTKQNNIYQSVFKIVIDKNNTAWGLVSSGLIRIVPEKTQTISYKPTLMINMVKAGKDTIFEGSSFQHKQNNISFHFSATSFLDEKQVLYSYSLKRGSNNQWSEPSNNSTVSFIDLPPGEYTLGIKASFPASRYPEQEISYTFTILPPWWRTWWFRGISGLLIIGLLIIAVRYYYRRKLERQMLILEKQQAVEKERTRIATDMHDDLGAGLSRIKFLSQSMNKKLQDENLRPEMEKITLFSDEMSEKMGEIIWALNEKNDTVADLIAYARSYAAEYLSNHGIECEATTPSNLPGSFIPGEVRRNIFLSVKESLHNVVKHSEATKVLFTVELNGRLEIIIHDNGKGIDWKERSAFSNGIQNITRRMKDIHGEVNFSNEQGTKVSLIIPLFL